MDKESEHIKTLLNARERLVAERRALAGTLAKEYERGHTLEEHFIAVQNTIDAIDRAIADEKHTS
jgi:hypothetical protein